MSSTDPSPARLHIAAIASPTCPPPMTSTSGVRGKWSGGPGSRATISSAGASSSHTGRPSPIGCTCRPSMDVTDDMAVMEVVLVPTTHWDREWYRTFQAFRARLVDTVDRVLELLDEDSGYTFL